MGKPDFALADDIAAILPQLQQATAYREQQCWHQALVCLDQALAEKPHLLALCVERALVLAGMGEYAEAIESLDRFLAHAPLAAIGDLRQELLDTAFADLEERLAANEKDLPARLQRIRLHAHLQQHAAAEADCAHILGHEAAHAVALNHLGNALLAQNRPGEARDAYLRAIEAEPQKAALHYNHGNVLQQLDDLEGAEHSYRNAIAIAPELAEAHMEIGHCQLRAGKHTGWRHLEWRWQSAQMRHAALHTDKPLWLGTGGTSLPEMPWPVANRELQGKTILVWAEQGLGDTLQFVRYLPQLTGCGATRVFLRAQETLQPLLHRLDPRVEFVGERQALPPFDVHCPLLSLPLALGCQTAPPPLPGLQAERGHIAEWRSRLGETPDLRVGIAWAGRQAGIPNPTRDMPLAALRPLAIPGVEIVSLQKEIPANDATTLAGWPELRRFENELGDFAQTAALIANLDLVLSVDTAVAHLAASLGKPCWLMLRQAGEWRWQRQRRDSPWYPEMTIFRQRRAGEWRDVVAEIRNALIALAA